MAVYLDASGSVPDWVVDQVAATVGPIPDTEVAWHTFDHEVHPFEPGQPLVGGGGTDFHAVVEHAGALDPSPDAVLVLTDGLAPPVRPPTARPLDLAGPRGRRPLARRARHGLRARPAARPDRPRPA